MKNDYKIFGKKGGVFVAGVWILLLILYFTIFIFIVNGSQNISIESDYNLNSSLNNYDMFENTGQCSLPRYFYSSNTGEIKETKYPDNMDCRVNVGVTSSETCNSINGCNWTEVTSGFWLWKETFETCDGSINGSYYGIETTNFLGGVYSKTHDNVNFNDENNVCTHPSVIHNKSLCSMFSCSWVETNKDIEQVNYKTLMSSVSDLFTFKYDFGFDNSFIAYIMNFIFFVLPLFMLIIAIYFASPVIH